MDSLTVFMYEGRQRLGGATTRAHQVHTSRESHRPTMLPSCGIVGGPYVASTWDHATDVAIRGQHPSRLRSLLHRDSRASFIQSGRVPQRSEAHFSTEGVV